MNSLLLLLITVLAESKPRVKALNWVLTDPNTSQALFWAVTDAFAGATLGLYIPITKFVRKSDCFSSMMESGAYILPYTPYFDNAINSDLLGFIRQVAPNIAGLVTTFESCRIQYYD